MPKCMSCQKAIVVITGSAHCFHNCIYAYVYIYVYIHTYIYMYICITIFIIIFITTQRFFGWKYKFGRTTGKKWDIIAFKIHVFSSIWHFYLTVLSVLYKIKCKYIYIYIYIYIYAIYMYVYIHIYRERDYTMNWGV